MIGVILCGGLGTRLRDAVPGLPKAMAPVRGKPFLEYQLDLLRSSGIRDVVLCVGYRWEAIEAHFGNGARFGVNLVYSVEEEPLGTAGCLKLAEAYILETALILNGDTLLSLNPLKMYEFHRANAAAVTVAVAPVTDAQDYGSVVRDRQGQILTFHEKQAAAGCVNAGAYLLEPAMLSYLTPGVKTSMEYDLVPRLLVTGVPVYAYEISGAFLDIGTPERYQKAQEGW